MANLFFSYSHKDEELRNELAKHLRILERNGIIESWHDRRIDAGQDLVREIDIHLKKANVILLLVSADFLDSNYCYEVEMKEAMKMHQAGITIVIPVILRPCAWHDAPFGKLLATPTDGQPVTRFSNRDDAYLEITQAIKKSLQPQNQRSSTSQTSFQSPQSSITSRSFAIPKKFTDREKDAFIDKAFEYMAQHFEDYAAELMRQNQHVETRFQRVDPKRFAIEIYVQGTRKAQAMVFMGGLPMQSKVISFAFQISQHTNSFNESLSIAEDGFNLSLKPIGMQLFGTVSDILSIEAAAEYYWNLTMRPLRKN